MSFQLSNVIAVLDDIVIILGLSIVLVGLILLTVKIYIFIQSKKQKVVYIELTPPAWTDRLPESTEQLFAALHGIGLSKSMRDRLLGRRSCMSLEIVSTRREGIRFVLRVSEHLADGVEQFITSYISDIKIKRIEDYLQPDDVASSRILSFKQAKHYAFPLKNYETLLQQDPIGYITNAMTHLADNELIALQLVISPIRLSEAETLRNQILGNEDVLARLDGKRSSLWPKLFSGINNLLFGAVNTIGEAYHGPSKMSTTSLSYGSNQKEIEDQKQVARRIKPARTLSYFEQELVESMHFKLSRPLFKTELRVLLSCKTKQEMQKRRRSLVSALNLLAVPKYQNLKIPKGQFTWLQRYYRMLYVYRLPALHRTSIIFSSSELASLYHFPHSEHAKTENIIKSLSKTLPAPVSLKNGAKLDVLIGENEHHGQTTPIGLTNAERQRHMYVVGGTGNGKTTMLKYQIVQDIKNGKGLAVIDPHGDLAEEILGYIPTERMKDVIYINPDDLSHPIGINLLELPEGISGDELLREKDIVTESTVSVLRKIFSEDDSGGHRIEYVLRNTIQTALTMDETNLFTIFRLLNDAKYRKNVVNNLENEDLKIFWKNEIGKAGEMQRVKMAAGITAKIGRFLFSASAKRILEQNKSTVSFDTAMDEKKIIICNFSKGLLGEDTSMLFGVTILAKLQLAALRRARQLQSDRSPYYLYVDEFQNFATMSFVQMLSEARKYKLFLVMAEQSTQQQDEQRLVDIILANVGTVIAFRTGSPADERIILPLFKPFIEENELSNLPSYNFYARMSAINAQEPVSGMTVLLDEQFDHEAALQIKEYSRNRYGRRIEESIDTTTRVPESIAVDKPEAIKKGSNRVKPVTS